LKDRNILLHVPLLLLFCALMGGIFPLIKIAEQTITPLTLAMLRAMLAALVLLCVVGTGMKRSFGIADFAVEKLFNPGRFAEFVFCLNTGGRRAHFR